MKIKKQLNGQWVDLELKEIQKYTNFSLYEVWLDGKPIFRTTYTDKQIEDLKKRDYKLTDTIKTEVL